MSVTIYIPLNDEGTDTWRPVHAAFLYDDVYEIEVDQEPRANTGPFRHAHWYVVASTSSKMGIEGY